MITYPYDRPTRDGKNLGEHPTKVDEHGEPLVLARAIRAALPTVRLRIRCEGARMEVLCEKGLTGGQKRTLDQAITDFPED